MVDKAAALFDGNPVFQPTWLSCWRQRLAGKPRTFVCKPTVVLGSLKNMTLSASFAGRVCTKSRLLVQIYFESRGDARAGFA